MQYHFVFVGLGDVGDVAESGDDCDVDASEWGGGYPSDAIEFWKDITELIKLLQ